MSIVAAFMVPHPPMIVPEIGRGSEAQIEETTKAYERVAGEIAALQPETIIITSPHSVMYSDYFHISPGKRAKGSFSDFRAGNVKFYEEYDEGLVDRICLLSAERAFPAGTLGEKSARLDHGTMVPLWFIRQKYDGFRIVRIGLSGLPLTDHYAFGMMLREAVDSLGRKAGGRLRIDPQAWEAARVHRDHCPHGGKRRAGDHPQRHQRVHAGSPF